MEDLNRDMAMCDVVLLIWRTGFVAVAGGDDVENNGRGAGVLFISDRAYFYLERVARITKSSAKRAWKNRLQLAVYKHLAKTTKKKLLSTKEKK